MGDTGYTEKYGTAGRIDSQEKRRRSREGAHMSKQLRDAWRGGESSLLMFVKQMECVCEREEGRVDGEQGEREALLLSPPRAPYVCEIRIKLNRLLGIIL